AVVGLAAALITAWQGPVTVFGDVTPHTFRWLWPLGAFVFFAVAITVGRRMTRDGLRTDRTAWLVGGFAAVTLLVAVLNLPYADEGSGPNSQEYAIPTAHDLDRQMGVLEHQGPLVIDDLFRGVFADPFGGSTVAELQRRGIPFLARDPMVVRQFGPGRVYNGHNARAELLLRVGAGTEDPPPGSRRVALARGLSAADRRERARLGSQLAAYVEAGNLELNARGEAALARGDLPNLSQFRAGAADARSLFDSREIDAMVERHLLDVHGVRARRLERYAELERRADLETVALFLRPLGNTASS
ncbi:MAG TPA: hypothetical protein VKE97_00015, partial [Acidimicrobiia bacterium]|nr:hypothetical protein [Acidimicrobiia bacterium]